MISLDSGIISPIIEGNRRYCRMKLVQETPKERFEKASAEVSKHCYEAGRLHYVIALDEEELEKKKLQLRNLKVDFDKLNKVFQKATDEFFAAEKKAKEALPESLPQ